MIANKPFTDYAVVWIKNGSGVFQVDFRNYSLARERVLFLGPGQYFRVLTGSFSLEEVGIPSSVFAGHPQLKAASRVLFTHVYEAGAVEPSSDLETDLDPADTRALGTWIREAANRWVEQKPLHPEISLEETDLIFDLRQLIEERFFERRQVDSYARDLGMSARSINRVTTSRIKRTIGDLIRSRRILQAQRELAFTDKTVKEIAYGLDFSDPAYFNRAFSNIVGVAPGAFRDSQESWRTDPFLEELSQLVDRHFRQTRSVAFFAEQLNLTPKALSAKVKKMTGHSVRRLIHDRVVSEACRLLETSDQTVQEIAWDLGFDEPSHFSRFFKRATGKAASESRRSKVESRRSKVETRKSKVGRSK